MAEMMEVEMVAEKAVSKVGSLVDLSGSRKDDLTVDEMADLLGLTVESSVDKKVLRLDVQKVVDSVALMAVYLVV